ncbi:MAG: hypothetical protein WBG15_08355 [Xanthobacteraceae bacterium]
MDEFLEIFQHRYGSLHYGGEVRRRQGISGEPTREDRGLPADDHFECGDEKQHAGHDRNPGCDSDHGEEKQEDAEGVSAEAGQ